MKTYCRLRDENATLVQLVYYCLASYYQSCLQAAGVFKVWICSHTYMFVCVCVVCLCLCVCVCVSVYVHTYVRVYICICVRTPACVGVCGHACGRTFVIACWLCF